MADKFFKGSLGRYLFTLVVIVLGVVLEYNHVGNEFLGFSSVGSWLIFVGFVMLAIITINVLSDKKKIFDERMEKIALKASRLTFLFLIFFSFSLMIVDGIKTIKIPYSLSMSYLIAFMMLVYFISYKILERFY